jgi:tryptophan synthase alpha chain
MNRIVEKFAALKRAGKKGFIVYIGAGDPNLEATRDLALAFDRAGVDILELGVPFSDPLADGLVNQLAAQRGKFWRRLSPSANNRKFPLCSTFIST